MDDAIKKRPLGVTILALLDIVGSLSFLWDMIFGDLPVSVLLFGKQFFGTFAYVYHSVDSLISLLIGIGLWKLKKLAWQAFIGFNFFGLFMFIIGMIASVFTSIQVAPPLGLNNNLVLFSIILIFVFYIMTTFYIFKKKEYFK